MSKYQMITCHNSQNEISQKKRNKYCVFTIIVITLHCQNDIISFIVLSEQN